MDSERYRVSVERLENGFEVEVPDMEARAKKTADAKKMAKSKGGMDTMSMPYMGDCTKKYAAKSVKEVLSLIKESLGKIPDNEFDTAFAEAAAE
ncbi:MAG: hypothetical protein NUW01_01375 [Gemmatimonadaceae bacterium]|nr:hypothetical protein [Gemmatimonadaceae bacterium]